MAGLRRGGRRRRPYRRGLCGRRGGADSGFPAAAGARLAAGSGSALELEAERHRWIGEAAEPALWEQDFDWGGFRWIDPDDSDNSVLSFLRFPASAGRPVACLANLTPVPRLDYRVGLPQPGRWVEILNSDHAGFGGSNALTGTVTAQAPGWNDLDYSATLTLPPLGVLWLAHDPGHG